MGVHKVLRMGDPRLLRVAEAVTEFNTPALDALVRDMFDTMDSLNGAGLAAPQIGINRRLVIFGFEANPRYPEVEANPITVLINPELEFLGPEMDEDWEGCLSVPGMRGLVPRYTRLRYCGFDQRGERFVREGHGFHARVVQLECDHLDGVLYPRRIRDLTQFGFEEELFPKKETAEAERARELRAPWRNGLSSRPRECVDVCDALPTNNKKTPLFLSGAPPAAAV